MDFHWNCLLAHPWMNTKINGLQWNLWGSLGVTCCGGHLPDSDNCLLNSWPNSISDYLSSKWWRSSLFFASWPFRSLSDLSDGQEEHMPSQHNSQHEHVPISENSEKENMLSPHSNQDEHMPSQDNSQDEHMPIQDNSQEENMPSPDNNQGQHVPSQQPVQSRVRQR